MSRVAASPRGAPARLTPRAPSTRRRSAGDGIEGVPRDDRTVVRFWHLWGSSPDARSRVTRSPRDSPYRDAALLESRVRALARVFDERSGLDVPALLAKAPELLTRDVAEVTRATVALKRCAPELTGAAITRAAQLLCCDVDDVATARTRMALDLGEDRARKRVATNPEELLEATLALSAAREDQREPATERR